VIEFNQTTLGNGTVLSPPDRMYVTCNGPSR
jgi:hypothetical protein